MHIPLDSWKVLRVLVRLVCQIRPMEATIMRIEASIPQSRVDELKAPRSVRKWICPNPSTAAGYHRSEYETATA